MGSPSCSTAARVSQGSVVLRCIYGQGAHAARTHTSIGLNRTRRRHHRHHPHQPTNADAAGIVTCEKGHLNLRKDNGLVAEVFHQEHMTKMRVRAFVGTTRHARFQLNQTNHRTKQNTNKQ